MNQWRTAIDQALLLQQQPALRNAFRSTALPSGLSNVIRLASDEGDRREELAQLLEIDVNILQKAAADYLLEICLYPDSNYLRCLCVNDAADIRLAKEHHKLLLKWLHPDRNSDNKNLAERVNQAWSVFKQNTKGLELEAVATNASSTNVIPESIPSGRFPLFLWGLAALIVLFLALSLIPDSSVYVAESDISSSDANSIISEAEDVSNESNLEKKLGELKLSFGEIKKAVLPTKKEKNPDVATIKSKEKVKYKAMQLSDAPQTKIVASDTSRINDQVASVAQIENIDNVLPVVVQKQSVVNVEPANTDALLASSKQEAIATKMDESKKLQNDGLILMSLFQQRYELGNIDTFMNIFTSTASNNQGGIQVIRNDYLKFFESSSSRKINFSNVQCQVMVDVVNCSAKYKTTVRKKGEFIPNYSKGQLEMLMVESQGKLLIKQLLIQN